MLDNHPFLRHEFLHAMEVHQCVGKNSAGCQDILPSMVTVVRYWAPCLSTKKHNSYGEFVFDHAWAEAYQRYGLPLLSQSWFDNPLYTGRGSVCSPLSDRRRYTPVAQ